MYAPLSLINLPAKKMRERTKILITNIYNGVPVLMYILKTKTRTFRIYKKYIFEREKYSPNYTQAVVFWLVSGVVVVVVAHYY